MHINVGGSIKMQKCDDVFCLMWQVSFKMTFNAIKKKQFPWEKPLAGGVKLWLNSWPVIRMQEAEFHVPPLPSCGTLGRAAGGGSSTVESNRWWTYAALMHAIITFISWRWHVTSSGSQAVTEAGSIAFFFSTPHHSSTPNYPHSQLQAKKHKSVCFFCLVKLHNNRVKKVSVYSGTLKGLKRLWWACQASSWRCGLGIWHAAIL